ncbi:MAG: hypothetical protein ABMA13_13100 [Chthoniobacteraceae bacterium]
MKTKVTTLILTLTTCFAFGHADIEIGPNGGRVLEFSKDESMHGELTVKDGKFHVALLDKNLKPVKLDKQSLTATGGTREKPEKLAVEKTDKGFVVPLVKAGQWLILQYKHTPEAKAVTARLEYDTSTCGSCKKVEWMCDCGSKNKKK